jgi:hypothetical protein
MNVEAQRMVSLNKDIADVLGLLGVLLAFLIGYFSAILPIANELIQRPAPVVQGDKASLASRLSSYRVLALGIVGLIVLVLALLSSLSVRGFADLPSDIFKNWPTGNFPTLRAGLLLVDFLMVVMLVATVRLLLRISKRIDELK